MVYETHVGTFTPEGTLDAAVERLAHLVDLGVDVVELLPLASFPGGTTGATTASRRTPCTRRTAARPRCSGSSTPRTPTGSAVCLDVVYNHLGPGRELPRRDRAVLHRHARRPRGARRSTSTARDSDEVRRWVLDNVQQWLRDFHVDGLRLDAVHELHDDSALHLLEEMSREVDALAATTGRHAVADRRVRPQRPRHGHPARAGRRGRRARACTRSGPTTSTTRCTSR